MYLIETWRMCHYLEVRLRTIGYAKSLKDAKRIVADLNRRATRNTYRYVRLKGLK